MPKRRKRTDPVATRYRVALTALAKAERRKAAAEKAIKELRRKVRYYESRIPTERRHEIAAGTAERRARAQSRADAWKHATKTLLVAARTVGSHDMTVRELRTEKVRVGLWVNLRESQVMVWHRTRGYLVGLPRVWRRTSGALVNQPDWTDLQPPVTDPAVLYREAA